MTLAEMVRQKVAEAGSQQGRHELNLPDQDSGWVLNLVLDRRDELGCLIWDLSLRRTRPAPAAENLGSWARRIAQLATGLLEHLKVVEIDQLRNEGFLRSDPPASREGQIFYYEVFLKGVHEARMRRYQAGTGTDPHRTPVPFALTHEALAKLAGDLTA